MYDFTPIINAVLVLLATVVTVFVIPWLKSKKTAEQVATIEQQVKTIVSWVTTAVQAAEIIFKGTGLGEDKKNYVLSLIKTQCELVGFTFNEDLIAAQIEQIGQNLGLWGAKTEE